METTWKYMDKKLNPDELPTMKELLSEIEENGGTDAALAGIREKQYRQYCCELIWRYPISQGDSAGGFLMPVQEGILWIPYDEMEKEAGEILRTCDAVLMDEAACRTYAEDFRAYADELCSALRQSACICRSTGRGNHDENIIDLGAFEMVSDRMAVSDPCYDTDVWCRGELEDVHPGMWEASVIKRDEGEWGMRVTRLAAVHKEYVDSDMGPMTLAPFEVGVDSGQAGLFDAQHYRDDTVVMDPGTVVNSNDAVLSWDYGEYGSDVAYWHSFDPADEDGIILMPVRDGMLSIPFGAGNHLFSPDGLQVEKAEILSVEDCWCIQDNCYNTDAKPGAAKIWEEAAMISLSMGNHDHEDDLCE